MTTYCYAHRIVDEGCDECLSRVAAMLRGDHPYRDDITVVEAYSAHFPQVEA